MHDWTGARKVTIQLEHPTPHSSREQELLDRSRDGRANEVLTRPHRESSPHLSGLAPAGTAVARLLFFNKYLFISGASVRDSTRQSHWGPSIDLWAPPNELWRLHTNVSASEGR